MLKYCVLTSVGLLALVQSGLCVVPVVKTVPWVASNPLIPHDTWSGKVVTLKGTCDQQGAGFTYTWDFGDGSAVAAGTVVNKYAIEASHTYAGAAGTIFTATLTVQDTGTGQSASKQYYVKVQNKSLPIEVNVAIDEGLWYLHKTQIRGATDGYWSVQGYFSETAANVNAFEVNGHLEGGDPSNPYTETVSRGMKKLFTYLNSFTLSVQGLGNPDSNGNGIGLYVNQSYYIYQGGMFIDAFIASGTPTAVASTGPANVAGRTYKDIVQDMVDFFAQAQYDGGSGPYPVLGGWRYNLNDFPDNSANQWAAIGLIPAEHNWGCTVPPWVKTSNVDWLKYSQQANGIFGYTGTSPIFGPFGTTPSGMVQLAMDGVGRGNAMWDHAETYMRDHFGDAAADGQYANNVKEFYYGEIAFVKSMLLHDSNGDGVPEPITLLHSQTMGVPDIDWYSAQAPPNGSDPTDGIARSLVSKQNANKSWTGHSWTSATDGESTAWAIIMLQRTLFAAGAPVAVATANPNPAVAGQIVHLDGSSSFHQDPTKHIVLYEWDLDNNGTFETVGVFPTVSFPSIGNYPVKLRVTDDGSPTASAETTLTIIVNVPPLAPTADAGGPYNFCPNITLFLDGTGSSNPDDGQHEGGAPPDHIISYEWDLDGSGTFTGASGAQPDVTAFFAAKPPGTYLVQLRVTDNTALSFPSSGFGNLSSVASTTVKVHDNADNACTCISDLKAFVKSAEVQLYWTSTGAHHYNVYRGTVNGGPYLKIGTTPNSYSYYYDKGLVNGTTYYYVVRPANMLDQEQCQSNQASGKPTLPRGR